MVTNVNDFGSGSLRTAILNANSEHHYPPDAMIDFGVPGTGVHTIRPSSPLPVIRSAVVIDGTSQPGYVPGGPLIELSGSNAGITDGLVFGMGVPGFANQGGAVEGIVINSFVGNALTLQNEGGYLIAGNFIGTDPTGSFALPNGAGIAIGNFSVGNIIGGRLDAARNIVSGNRTYGVAIFDRLTTGNLIQGNYIGTDFTGTRAIPNDEGVDIFSGASGNTVGGLARNLISGNTHEGVHMFDRNTSRNLVENNYIGTDASGTIALPNGFGLSITGGASGNVIGGTLAGTRNIISGNAHYGVGVLDSHTTANTIQGNYIGTDVSGTLPLGNGDDGIIFPSGGLSGAASGNLVGGTDPSQGNTIAYNGADGVRVDTGTGNSVRANSIFGHFNGLGIELVNDGNDSQAAPRLRSVTSDGSETFIRGSLRSARTPNTSFTIEFFRNMTCDVSGEGEVFLGTASVTTDANGHAQIRAELPVSVPAGQFVTATATSSEGDTSEFSNCQVVTTVTVPDVPTPDTPDLARLAQALRAGDLAAPTARAAAERPRFDPMAVDRYFRELFDNYRAPPPRSLTLPFAIPAEPVRANATMEEDIWPVNSLAWTSSSRGESLTL
jgi:hypothetical protein